MFDRFDMQWTPIELCARVGRGRTLRVSVAGEHVALFRSRRGALAALIDRCPHRGVALSLGKVTREGEIECPFHGWRFDAAGRCTAMPLCDAPITERNAATS